MNTRPHACQGDRDRIEDRLPGVEDQADEPLLLHVYERTES